ncbi:MAG: hypothetical protein ACREP2_03285 [Rhodanobacteraceae bacterium]
MTNDNHDEKLRDALAALPREIAPERDLWPGIAARIAPRRHRLQPLPVAAAVAGLIAIGVLAAALSMRHPQAPATFATRQPATRSQPATGTPVPDARARSIAATIRNSTRQDPRTQAVLLANLDLTETSISKIQHALRTEPGNPSLQPLLYQQYRNEAVLVAAAQRVQLQTDTGVIAP